MQASKTTTTVVHFDSKEWYLIDYDSSTVTLLSKECVGASQFDSNGSSNTYSGSTVETYVNNWYTNNISTDAKNAVNGSGAFLLKTDQANTIKNANADVLKCTQATEADLNYWWLCSPGNYYLYAAYVGGELGDVHDSGNNVLMELGVRPALKHNLSSVIFESSSNTFTVGSATIAVTGVSLNKTETAITVGGTETLTATVSPDDSTDKTVTWSSDNESVATVSDGVVTAVAEGTANITVTATNGTEDTSDDKKATCAVTVETPVDPISYITAKADPYNTGTYYATFYDSTTSYVADCEVYYATENADGRFTLEKAEGNVIKADEGVILKATSETVTLTQTDAAASYDSLLTGSDSETTVENALVLSLGKNGVWFYKYSGTLGANKAYLAQ